MFMIPKTAARFSGWIPGANETFFDTGQIYDYNLL